MARVAHQVHPHLRSSPSFCRWWRRVSRRRRPREVPCWKELSEATSGYGSGPVLGQGARPSGVTSRPAWQSTGWPPGALAEPVVGPLVTPGSSWVPVPPGRGQDARPRAPSRSRRSSVGRWVGDAPPTPRTCASRGAGAATASGCAGTRRDEPVRFRSRAAGNGAMLGPMPETYNPLTEPRSRSLSSSSARATATRSSPLSSAPPPGPPSFT